jgi:CrcB protein
VVGAAKSEASNRGPPAVTWRKAGWLGTKECDDGHPAIEEANMSHYLAVGIGGFLGSIARYWLTGVVQRHANSFFPYGTMAVNVLGCLSIGLVWGLVEYRQMFSPNARLFLTVGFLGGFTTFSAFGNETFLLLREAEYLSAIANVVGSVAAGLLAVFAGWSAAKWFAM